MIQPVRMVLGAVVVAGALAGIGALSQAPYGRPDPDAATLRLAWRARSVRVEVCRHRSAEELEKLPIHMREDEVCEGRLLPYRLQAEVDGELVTDREVEPAGARGDRPIYVFREVTIPAGRRALRVRFQRMGVAPVEPPETHPEEHGPAVVAPPLMELDTVLAVEPGEVVLVTYDEGLQSLVVRGAG